MKQRVLIGSPIHQRPEILKEFLFSLQQLTTLGLEVGFYFIDENERKDSKELILHFSREMNQSQISTFIREVPCDGNFSAHNWNEERIWKVAEFKNQIINEALEKNYDYLFLVDSDLLLHPQTLLHLIEKKKEIISEIFWTQWDCFSPKLPQVWLRDQYNLYESKREEKVSDEEKSIRQSLFLQKLRKPGVYEVGGLGACTLISRKVILSGVNFNEIKNISLIGEDRHFCIRAIVSGFPLFVDTCLPAFHMYRESDLSRVRDYFEICKELEKDFPLASYLLELISSN